MEFPSFLELIDAIRADIIIGTDVITYTADPIRRMHGYLLDRPGQPLKSYEIRLTAFHDRLPVPVLQFINDCGGVRGLRLIGDSIAHGHDFITHDCPDCIVSDVIES